MAAKAKSKRTRSASDCPQWSEITWEDLEAWADPGSLERGEGYFHGGNVRSLAITPGGELLAWVEGTERYAVQIALAPRDESPRLASLCTCPVGYACKHAVAAVLTYLEALSEGRTVPLARPNDPRLRAFDYADEDDAPWDDELLDDGQKKLLRLPVKPPSKEAKCDPADLRSLLASKSHEELIELALHLTNLILGVRDQLGEAAALLSPPEIAPQTRSHRTKSDRRIDRPHRGPRLARSN